MLYARTDAGWYVVHSSATGHAVGVTWPAKTFPCLWIWQECEDPAGYPWWGRHHIVGVEPHSATPAHGVAEDVRAGSALWLAPGVPLSAAFRLAVSDGRMPLQQFVDETARYADSGAREQSDG
ncbi:hypothetical protein GCM10025866_33850 [Naasia aerilata]|uniref:DUF985 domain-containing protein n=1 Tax=Naasia aerilata TaxID=1162966 RepID=A0ABM8GGI5_9MICO|nr:hypothetical protein GCM10025866_33850 [Naasia aerilata]